MVEVNRERHGPMCFSAMDVGYMKYIILKCCIVLYCGSRDFLLYLGITVSLLDLIWAFFLLKTATTRKRTRSGPAPKGTSGGSCSCDCSRERNSRKRSRENNGNALESWPISDLSGIAVLFWV